MADLIDRQELLKHKGNCYDEEGHLLYAVGTGTILLMPTVDAEPVVRCKDCKWYVIAQLKRDGTDNKRYKPSVCVIGVYAEPRKADWYCADGERREDGQTD